MCPALSGPQTGCPCAASSRYRRRGDSGGAGPRGDRTHGATPGQGQRGEADSGPCGSKRGAGGACGAEMRRAPCTRGAARAGNREGAGAHPFPLGRRSRPPDAAAGTGRTRASAAPAHPERLSPASLPESPRPAPRAGSPQTPAREAGRARGCPGAGTGPQGARGCLRGGGEPPGTAPVWDRLGGSPEGCRPGWKKAGLWGPYSCPRSR